MKKKPMLNQGCGCALTANARQQDPAGLRAPIRRASRGFRKRLNGAYKDVSALLKKIPSNYVDAPKTFATNRRVYTFDLTNRDIDAEIKSILEHWLESQDTKPYRWFIESEIGGAYRKGTAQSAGRLELLTKRARQIAAIDAAKVLSDKAYRDRLNAVYSRMFEEMNGFTGDVASDLARVLAEQMGRGVGVQTITSAIKKRFDVSVSRAEKIARTEIGNAFRMSRLDMNRDARDRLGLDAGMQWVSALAPTTRPTHAVRHMNFYTPEEVADFYSIDGNAINCLCYQQDVIRTEDGDIIGAREATARELKEIEQITKPVKV